ncbi:MAG: flap endonuclease-1 [Candidatus Bathyarchaeia archaeon]
MPRLGVNLTPLVVRHVLGLEDLRGKSFAVDANNFLYQFLAVVRLPNGTLLKDSKGNITSHLVGLMFRSTRLMLDYDVDLVFVFDGKPPELKAREILERRKLREKAFLEWQKALEAKDYTTAFSKAVMTSRLTEPLIQDAKTLLGLLGIPFVQAPSEAEAQIAHMAIKGDVWAASSKDYDTLLFGAPRLLRYLTITGKEFLPSKGVARPLKPELIVLQEFLSHHQISREQLVDLAILIGTDFNEGIKGIGPKTALRLVKEHGKLENMPEKIVSKLPSNYDEIREIFLQPKVTDNYAIQYGTLQEDKLYEFLCEKHEFSKQRVGKVIQRMKNFYSKRKQSKLSQF